MSQENTRKCPWQLGGCVCACPPSYQSSHHLTAHCAAVDHGLRTQLRTGRKQRLLNVQSAHLLSHGHEEASHTEAGAETDSCNVAANVLHGVVNGQRRHNLQA